MKVSVVSVCVNYADFLKISLPINKQIFSQMIIVTDSRDLKTQEVCKKEGVTCIVTDVFYEKGKFNKYAGINEGLKYVKHDWILFLDADIVLDPLTKRTLSELTLNRYNIYGIDRVNCTGIEAWEKRKKLVIDNWLLTSGDMDMGARICQYYGQQGDGGKFAGWKPLGFFQLIHKSTLENGYPQSCTGADHCDIVMANRYHRNNRVLIPEILGIHLESVGSKWGDNWQGRTSVHFGYREKNKVCTFFLRLWGKIKRFFSCKPKPYKENSNFLIEASKYISRLK